MSTTSQPQLSTRPAILAVRFWRADPWKDGGTKRSAQIDACVSGACPEAELIELIVPQILGWKKAITILLHPRYWRSLYRLRKFDLRIAVRGARDAALVREWTDVLGNRLKMVIWEATPSAGVLVASDKPVVAFPHNLESLTSGGRQMLGRKAFIPALQQEIALLKRCSMIFFISKEEAFLGRNLALPVGYFPYFPPEPVRAKLEQVRANRLRSEIEPNFLILGSATNAPTAESIEKLLQAIRARHDLTRVRFVLCGSGTERFDDQRGGSVEVRGRVSDADLTRLLVTCKAAIVFQESGSGALTRIPELLLAGVPVIANLHAARSVEKCDGLYVVEDINGVLDLVSANSFLPVARAESLGTFGAFTKGILKYLRARLDSRDPSNAILY